MLLKRIKDQGGWVGNDSKEATIMASVTVYSAPGCTGCKMSKEFLNENKVPFEEKSISEEKNLNELREKYNSQSTPTIVIDNEVIVGYKPERFKELLHL